MRGQDRVIASRLAGYAPSLVLMHVLDEQAWPAPDGSVDGYVQIELKDRPNRLDLRFVVGMPVVISGLDGERVKAMGRAVIAAGCRGMLGFCTSLYKLRCEDMVCADGDLDWIGGGRLGDDHP